MLLRAVLCYASSCAQPRSFRNAVVAISMLTTVLTTILACMCRFFMFWAIVFVTHQVGVCIFRCTAVVSRNIVVANGMGMLMLLCCILLDGFVIVKRYIHPWVVW